MSKVSEYFSCLNDASTYQLDRLASLLRCKAAYCLRYVPGPGFEIRTYLVRTGFEKQTVSHWVIRYHTQHADDFQSWVSRQRGGGGGGGGLGVLSTTSDACVSICNVLDEIFPKPSFSLCMPLTACFGENNRV